nr:glycosyltransferase [Acidobacteriota bacterium]
MSASIVLTTFGSLGDIHPYVALALGLRGRGHRVAIATGEFYRGKIEALGIGFHPVRPNVSLEDRELIAFMMDVRKGPERVLRSMVFPALRESYEDLLAAARGADLLVSHVLTFAAPVIAEVLGLRWASVTLAPMSFFSAFDPPVLTPYPALARLRALGPGVNRRILELGKRSVLP